MGKHSEKLIRDRIAGIPHPDYPSMLTRRVRDIAEHIFLLEDKKSEEYREFHNAEKGEEKMEEAADVLEVLDTLIDLYTMDANMLAREGIIHEREVFIERIRDTYILSIGHILQIQLQKREEKGGFREGVVWMR